MALPTSGAISANKINIELGKSGTTQLSIAGSEARALAGVSSGQISFSNFRGKSSGPSMNVEENQLGRLRKAYYAGVGNWASGGNATGRDPVDYYMSVGASRSYSKGTTLTMPLGRFLENPSTGIDSTEIKLLTDISSRDSVYDNRIDDISGNTLVGMQLDAFSDNITTSDNSPITVTNISIDNVDLVAGKKYGTATCTDLKSVGIGVMSDYPDTLVVFMIVPDSSDTNIFTASMRFAVTFSGAGQSDTVVYTPSYDFIPFTPSASSS